LLVSVQNESEATQARALAVPWVDLKNPARGSLGCPDVLTAIKVAAALAASPSLPECQSSVALGELESVDLTTANQLMQLFPIAKVGLAGFARSSRPTTPESCSQSKADLLAALDRLAATQTAPRQLVLAIYADHQRAAAPDPLEVIDLAARLGSRYVLIDTFVKDGLGLLHWQSPQQLAQLGAQAKSAGAELVLAGSLSTADWPQLAEAAPSIVGVRGSVCAQQRDRSSQLSPERVRQWLAWTGG
jgi:uncharacterized protein (UPF0264 family)